MSQFDRYAEMIDRHLAETGQVATVADRTKRDRKHKPAALHVPACMWCGEKLMILVGIQTANETNQRDWKSRNRRAGEAWKRTREAVRVSQLWTIEKAFAMGDAVKIEFCRLAPREIDRGSIGAAVKGVEDAMAYLCGVDDGSPLWQATHVQEKSKLYGVRVVVEVVE